MAEKEFTNIYLADDDEDDRFIFEDALNDTMPGTQLKTARNGLELMNKMLNEDTTTPDLIFLDLNMPVKNGFECLDEIRNSIKLKDVPVVIYTSSNNPDDVSTTFKLGADLYCVKSVTYPDLKNKIKKIVSSKPGSKERTTETFMVE